ncbi:MAG: hypothetical protein WB869_14960, partial [Candidatus Acidiferrales bacterium]
VYKGRNPPLRSPSYSPQGFTWRAGADPSGELETMVFQRFKVLLSERGPDRLSAGTQHQQTAWERVNKARSRFATK